MKECWSFKYIWWLPVLYQMLVIVIYYSLGVLLRWRCGLQKRKWQDHRENYGMRAYLSCPFCQILLGWSDQGNEVNRTNNKHMGYKNCVQNFIWKPWWLMPVGKLGLKWEEDVKMKNNYSVLNQTVQPYTRPWRAMRELITTLDIQRELYVSVCHL